MKTPLIRSKKLSALNCCNVWLKMESSQVTGSFKERSIGHACTQYAKQGAKKFISSSGGNAGIAVAYIGHQLNIPVTVTVPKTTSKTAIELMRKDHAEVIVHGDSWFEANELALSYVTEENIYIHPFDDPYLWEGISTIVDEIINDEVTPDAIVLSIGGGSLLSGIQHGLKKHKLNIPVYAVETEGTASLNTAMQKKQHITLDKVTGIATTLAAKKICKHAFDLSQQEQIVGVTVSDLDALKACFEFLDDHRTLVEPACGAALSVLYDQKVEFSHLSDVLVIVCGGATTSLNHLLDLSKDLSFNPKKSL